MMMLMWFATVILTLFALCVWGAAIQERRDQR